MLGTGTIHAYPITPMTLTLAIGTIDEKLVEIEGQAVKRKYLNLTLAADHDILDGSPLTKFVERLKELIRSGYGLQHQEFRTASSLEPIEILNIQ